MDEATRQGSPAVDTGAERSPEQIREEIEQTRRDVGDTAAALADKADVKKQAKAKVDDVKERVAGKGAETIGRAKEATPDSAGQAASSVAATAQRNPAPLVIAGAALAGFLVGRATSR